MTPKQKEVFEYIKKYQTEQGYPPTQREIKDHFELKSFGSVQRYLTYLKEEGLIENDWNSKRGLKITAEESQESHENMIPLLGNIAAGDPILALEEATTHIEVPAMMMKGKGPFFALKVKGDSMIEDGILENDLVICRHEKSASNGAIVAAVIDGEATLKHFEKKGGEVILHPANSRYSPIHVNAGEFYIAGIMVGLLRSFA